MARFTITALACLALVAGGFLVAGCGSDEGSGTTAAPAAEPPQTTENPKSADADAVTVSMKNSKMIPESITAKVGQKIIWTNDDGYDHNVTATAGADFASGNMPAAATFDYTPDKAGEIDYVCTIHSGQKGNIAVTR